MSDGRETIMRRVRQALGRDGDQRPDADSVAAAREEAVATAPPHQVWSGTHRERFLERFERAAGSWEAIAGTAEIPAAIARYMNSDEPVRIRSAPHPDLQGIPWPEGWSVTEGPGEDAGEWPIGIARAHAAIAETGTLVMPGAPERPTTLNFLPDVHIVVLRAAEIVDYMETAWADLAARGPLPRTVNFITGPSRTADVEQTLQLGAHGPRRLHVLLIDDATG